MIQTVERSSIVVCVFLCEKTWYNNPLEPDCQKVICYVFEVIYDGLSGPLQRL